MSREKRTVFIVILTLLVYALTQFLESGVFLFPFPLFDAILLLISFQFIYWNRKIIFEKKNLYFLFYLLALIFKVISSQFFLALIYKDQDLEQLNSGIFLDVILIFSTFFLALFFILWKFKQDKTVSWVFTLLFIALSFSVFFESTSLLSFFTMPVFACYLFFKKVQTEFTYLFFLHAFLSIMALTMVLQLN